MLVKFWQVHLKGKVVFNLAYGLHRFQIQFHLQIKIAISNFKLQLQFAISIYTFAHIYTIHEFEIVFQLKLKLQISLTFKISAM